MWKAWLIFRQLVIRQKGLGVCDIGLRVGSVIDHQADNQNEGAKGEEVEGVAAQVQPRRLSRVTSGSFFISGSVVSAGCRQLGGSYHPDARVENSNAGSAI